MFSLWYGQGIWCHKLCRCWHRRFNESSIQRSHLLRVKQLPHTAKKYHKNSVKSGGACTRIVRRMWQGNFLTTSFSVFFLAVCGNCFRIAFPVSAYQLYNDAIAKISKFCLRCYVEFSDIVVVSSFHSSPPVLVQSAGYSGIESNCYTGEVISSITLSCPNDEDAIHLKQLELEHLPGCDSNAGNWDSVLLAFTGYIQLK